MAVDISTAKGEPLGNACHHTQQIDKTQSILETYYRHKLMKIT